MQQLRAIANPQKGHKLNDLFLKTLNNVRSSVITSIVAETCHAWVTFYSDSQKFECMVLLGYESSPFADRQISYWELDTFTLRF